MPTSSSKKGKKKGSKSEHWKDLPRDSKGRWMKRGSKKVKTQKTHNQSTSSKKKPLSPKKPISKKKKEEKTTIPIKPQAMNKHCPRCGGKMRKQSIRCGPERLVKVNKCAICNYWIPIQPSV